MTIASLVAQMCAGTVDTLPAEELARKLASGKRLIIKFGADPTAADLHLGHAVALSKLKQFQDLGHTVVFLIGDFTVRIGDPTGRSKTRPPLSDAEIVANSATYLAQVGKILDLSRIMVRYNSEWLGKLSSAEWVTLCGKFTLARLIEREDFAHRLQQHISIGFHELLYPLMQGYDSVALEADLELGGTDQKFNLLAGRFLQEQFGMEPQVIMTLPLLEGLSGGAKMSKSLGNAVGLAEPADQAYGKLMSISDELMWHYAELLLLTPLASINQQKQELAEGVSHPMTVKKSIVRAIIARFWGEGEAEQAQRQFELVVQRKSYDEVPSFRLPEASGNPVWIVALVRLIAGCASSSEARRLVEAGAVYIDGHKIIDPTAQITIKPEMLVKVGKHTVVRIQCSAL